MVRELAIYGTKGLAAQGNGGLGKAMDTRRSGGGVRVAHGWRWEMELTGGAATSATQGAGRAVNEGERARRELLLSGAAVVASTGEALLGRLERAKGS